MTRHFRCSTLCPESLDAKERKERRNEGVEGARKAGREGGRKGERKGRKKLVSTLTYVLVTCIILKVHYEVDTQRIPFADEASLGSVICPQSQY